MKLQLSTYKAATSGFGFRRNRYFVNDSEFKPCTIGVGLLFGHKALSFTWRTPKRVSRA